jgi:hypothetical protein
MDRLSILNTSLKRQTETQDDITLDDLKADRSKTCSLDQMLEEENSPHNSASAFHESWSATVPVDEEQEERQATFHVCSHMEKREARNCMGIGDKMVVRSWRVHRQSR